MTADGLPTATEGSVEGAREPSAAPAARRLPLASVVNWGVFVLLAVVILIFRPMNAGGFTSYEFVTGTSMEPTMHTGDLAIVMAQDSYNVGDIVSYHPSVVPEGSIIHRIVGGDAQTGFIVRGDNRADDDPDRPTPDVIVGKSVLVVPQAGWLLNALREQAVMVGLILAVAAYSVWDIVRKRRENRSR